MDTTTPQPEPDDDGQVHTLAEVGGFEVPVDPMDLLQCEACQ